MGAEPDTQSRNAVSSAARGEATSREYIVGDAEEHRGTTTERLVGISDGVEDCIGLERRLQYGTCADGERAVQPHAEAVHVKQRQRQYQHVVGRPAPRQLQRSNRCQQVRMAQHRALGPTGRARGVADQGSVLGLALGGQRSQIDASCAAPPGAVPPSAAEEFCGIQVAYQHVRIDVGDPLPPLA